MGSLSLCPLPSDLTESIDVEEIFVHVASVSMSSLLDLEVRPGVGLGIFELG